MSSFSVNDERMLSLITEQLNNVLDRVFITVNDAEAVGVCGFPCLGDCHTCTQSNADLDAFYAAEPAVAVPVATAVAVAEPVSASIEGGNSAPLEEGPVEVMAYAGDESQGSVLENARAMDAIEEAQRSGEAYDDDGYRGCQCLDCLNADDENYIPSYYDDRDDGYGLDWNESGYFD
jgi:hypothetical protein